ncbi:MAG: bifunctional demethylmenaquinone methyltransferase/2-methoxy-6-polyprenyl-1,4-benzoquinol methylase UbiE [Bacteroidia bacterium]|nr:bifunctional demethylmenaquinone methyltransferase/2-methoxy-6-polyprenyl-1,4-benzoquinol methylase UbiE [Bacteroidia bacterium]
MKQVLPYPELQQDKKQQVSEMFNRIALTYDFLNHFLSAGIDRHWRKRAVKILHNMQAKSILDVASGTADFAIETVKINPRKIIGIDLSENMLAIGRKKILKKGLESVIELVQGDCEALPFSDNNFDAVTVGFGVRNFMNPLKGLKEINRVLRPGGKLVVLEFSKPNNYFVSKVFNFYFKIFCPFIGGIISKDKKAYRYLQSSVADFPDGKNFLSIMETAGFINSFQQKLTFGIASIYCGTK